VIIDRDQAGGSHNEPCLQCGDETAIGSPRFSDRHSVDLPGVRGYLCGECLARIRQSGHYEGLSDERMVEVWSAFLTGGWL
jgi:hypothetical protein